MAGIVGYLSILADDIGNIAVKLLDLVKKLKK